MMRLPLKTPAELGYRMPAEWTRHEATWLGWPHNRTDWPGKIEPIHWVYGEIVRRIAPGEKLRILVNDAAHQQRAQHVLQQVGVNLKRIEFFRIPTNRGWTRDSGPIFVKRESGRGETAIVKFRFNAWAKYRDWRKDATVPDQAARMQRKRVFEAWVGAGSQWRMMVLEGGGVDVNGRGSLLTTEEWLLDQKTQARNPGMSQQEVEAALREYLGATNVMWLGRGIAGDDTHGHVDDLCRFVNARTIVLCREKNPRDANYRALEENWERVGGLRLENGYKPEVLPLPMPAPLVFAGQRLPASYANFYICNAAVIVPTFNDANDRVALGTLAEVFRDRPVIGIHAVDLVWGLGTLHCLTQQQPA